MDKIMVFYGQEIYDQIANLQEYEMGHFRVGQLVNNGLDWGIIEGFLKSGEVVVRVPLPGDFMFSQHEKQQVSKATCCFSCFEAWKVNEIAEIEDRDIIKRLRG